MMRIDFYHLTLSSLERFLPSLAENIIKTAKNAVILFKNDGEIEKFNDLLWTYKDDSFIPHGSKNDGSSSSQPIFMTANSNDNPNMAKFMVYTYPLTTLPDASIFERCFIIFNGKNPMEVEAARSLWKKGMEIKAETHYWQDTPTGWIEKK